MVANIIVKLFSPLKITFYVIKPVNYLNLHIFKMAAMSEVECKYCDYIL